MVLPKRNLHVLVAVLISVARVDGRETRDDGGTKDDDLLEKMLTAVKLGVHFFSQDYSSINVDGLFGLRVGQGQIIQAIQECKSSSSCPDSIARRLEVLSEEIDVTARAAMKYVKAADPEYFDRFIATVNHPYLLRYVPKTLKDLDKTPAGYDQGYDEDKGDGCLSRIMGTFQEHGQRVKECNITRSCWNMMTAGGQSQYSITHQLLYFIVIEKQGCLEVVENTMGAKVADTEARMCGSIYNEAVSEVKDGKVEDLYQDLFLEQVLVCGCLGFENFMRTDWMHMVLKWQNSNGCFTMDDPILRTREQLLSEYKEQERQLLKDLKWEADMMESQQHGRKLQREQFMSDGCLSHKSGLGFGTVCLYTRYLIRHNFLHL